MQLLDSILGKLIKAGSNSSVLNFAIIISMALLALSIGARVGADYTQKMIRQELRTSDVFSAQQILTAGIDYSNPETRELRLPSPNFAKSGGWNDKPFDYTWAPPSGKSWVVWETVVIIDQDAIYPDLQVFDAYLRGEMVARHTFSNLVTSTAMCSEANNVTINGRNYVILRYQYRVPFLLQSRYKDYIRVSTISQHPIKASTCYVTMIVTEKPEAKDLP